MFASERDLLAIEPHAFTDALWAGRRVTGGQGDVSGTTLTATSASVGFDAAQVAAGQVVVVAGVPLEVVSVVSATQLAVSLLRDDFDGALAKAGRLQEIFDVSSHYEARFWQMCWSGETW